MITDINLNLKDPFMISLLSRPCTR